MWNIGTLLSSVYSEFLDFHLGPGSICGILELHRPVFTLILGLLRLGFSFGTWLNVRNIGTSVPSTYIVLRNAFDGALRLESLWCSC